MAALLGLLGMVAGLVGFVCFILVVVKMFQNGQTALGIVSIVGLFCVIGYFVAMVYGWMKATEWNIKNIMLIWTGCFVVAIIINIIQIATGAATFQINAG